jgi:hypothetical protein
VPPLTPFLLGANLPWIRYGDFGTNAWHPSGVFADVDRAWLADRLHAARAVGVSAVRWFVFCDGRAGIRFDADGWPLGVDDGVYGDLETALGLVADADLRLVPVLFDFQWCARRRVVRGVQLGGRSSLLAATDAREALLDRIVSPVLERFGQSPVILAWDVFNEPEWVTRGVGTWRPWRTLSRETMRTWLAALVDRVHAHTHHLATIGSASARWIDLVRGLGLDVYQPHWYEHLERHAPLARPLADLGLDRPAWLGEFPTRPGAPVADAICEAARAAGYTGAFAWSLISSDSQSEFGNASARLSAWAASHGAKAEDAAPPDIPGTAHPLGAPERQAHPS